MPLERGSGLLSSALRNPRMRLIMRGPENCSKLETMASIPEIKNVVPMYFLNPLMSLPLGTSASDL